MTRIHDAQALANLINCEVWLLSNDQTVASNTDLARVNLDSGATIISTFKPERLQLSRVDPLFNPKGLSDAELNRECAVTGTGKVEL